MSQNFLSTQFLVNTHLEDVPNVNVHWTFTFHLKNSLWKRSNDFQVGSTQVIHSKYNTISALPKVWWIHSDYWRFQQPTSFTHSAVTLASFTQREKQLLLDAKETDFATQKSQHFSQSHISVSQNLQMKSLSRISFKYNMNFSTFCVHWRGLLCVELRYDIPSIAAIRYHVSLISSKSMHAKFISTESWLQIEYKSALEKVQTSTFHSKKIPPPIFREKNLPWTISI